MSFLKKHYEKILLGVMLAGLIGVLVFMLFYIAKDTEDMNNKRLGYFNPPVRPLTNLDMSLLDSVMARARTPYTLDLESKNKLFNPREWERDLDNHLIPVNETGTRAAVVTNIAPLYTVIWLDSVITNELGVRYVIKVERQAAATPVKRHPVTHYVSMGDKANSDFELASVKGAPDNPESLTLKLTDTGEEVQITKENPYRHVDGYLADIKYDPEKKVFRAKRAGDKISFDRVDYTVVEVNRNEVILEDQSNHKKTSLPFER